MMLLIFTVYKGLRRRVDTKPPSSENDEYEHDDDAEGVDDDFDDQEEEYDNVPETPAKAGLSDGGRVVLCILAPLAAAAAAKVGGQQSDNS